MGDQGANIARTEVLAAKMPDTVGGFQLNRFCASGLEAVNSGAQKKIRSGWDEIVLAGGEESKSRVPMDSDGGAWSMNPATSYDTYFAPQGIGTDLIAATRSQQRAAAAWSGSFVTKSVVPVILDHDEHTQRRTVRMSGSLANHPAPRALGATGRTGLHGHHRKSRLKSPEARQRQELVGEKSLVCGQVPGGDEYMEIRRTEHASRFDHLVMRDELCLEQLASFRRLVLEVDLDQHLERTVDGRGRDAGVVTGDNTLVLESLNTPQARRGRQTDSVGQFDVRLPAITAQLLDNCPISLIH